MKKLIVIQTEDKPTTVVSEVFHSFNEIKNDRWKKWETNQSEKYKLYRKLWQEIPARGHVAESPLHLDIEVTSKCNLLCTFCARTQRVQKNIWRTAGDMDMKLFKKIAKNAANAGVFAFNFNILGEPLLHKEIEEMIAYSKECGIVDVFFHTNGTNLTEKMARKLIDSGLDKLIISFDSPYKEKYEKVRVNANYDKVLKNVIRFNQIRNELGAINPVTRINFIKFPDTSNEEVEDMIKLFVNHVDSIGLLTYIETDNDFRKTLEATGDYKSKFVCSQLLTRLSVYDDGTVVPCCSDYDTEMVLGNLNEMTIEEIWKSDKLNEIRRQHFRGEFYKIPACAKCDYALQYDRNNR